MSAGPPASAVGSNLFPNLPRSVVTNPQSSVSSLLQQQLAPAAPVSGSGPGYVTAYPPPNSFLGNPYFAAAAAAAAAAASSPGSSPFGNFLNPEKHQQQQQSQRIKLKRTRQRVDAGEPRNTYSSFIPAYQKTPSVPFSTSATPLLRPSISDSSTKQHSETAESLVSGSFLLPHRQHANASYVHDLLRGMHFQQPATETHIHQSSNGEKPKDFADGNWSVTSLLKACTVPESDPVDGKGEKVVNGTKRPPSEQSPTSDLGKEDAAPPKKRSRSGDVYENGAGSEIDKKTDSPTSGPMNGGEVTANRSKRKQYQPQQLDVKTASRNEAGREHDDEGHTTDPLLLSMTTTDFENSENGESDDKSLSEQCGEDEDESTSPLAVSGDVSKNDQKRSENEIDDENELDSGDEILDGDADEGFEENDRAAKVERMQGLMLMHQRYVEMLAAQQQQKQQEQHQRPRGKEDRPDNGSDAKTAPTLPNGTGDGRPETKTVQPVMKEVKNMSEALKSDLYLSVCNIVDEWVERMQKCIQAEAARLHAAQLFDQQQHAPLPFGRHVPPAWTPRMDSQIPNRAPNGPVATSNPAPMGMGQLFVPAPPNAASHGKESSVIPSMTTTGPRPQFYFNPFYYNSFPYASAGLNFAAAAAAAAAASGQQGPPSSGFMSPTMPGAAPNTAATPSSTIFPSFQGTTPVGGTGSSLANHSAPSPFMGLNLSHKSGSSNKNSLEETSPTSSSLPMPRKKRSKVTDTRVTKLNYRNDDLGPLHAAAAAAAHQLRGSPAASATSFFAAGGYPPTLLPPHLLNPHHHQSPFGSGPNSALGAGGGSSNFDDDDLGAASPDNSDGTGSEMTPYDPNMPQSCTLTPMHLRKAKLMFFYTRYPSSALLKAYFPDIRFNKNNTAQLVKWFSNFREFYYIQMEKYARQALAEGVKSSSEIFVRVDSELYKVLNLHYNRNNHIQVPPNFRGVIEATLKEFFVAIQGGRDAEPSWKKSIYKIIARLDDQIPEYFKTPNFLEQLE